MNLVQQVFDFVKSHDPWLGEVYCNVNDFVEAGFKGDSARLNIEKHAGIGSSAIFERVLSMSPSEHMEYEAEELRSRTHVVKLIPNPIVWRGAVTK